MMKTACGGLALIALRQPRTAKKPSCRKCAFIGFMLNRMIRCPPAPLSEKPAECDAARWCTDSHADLNGSSKTRKPFCGFHAARGSLRRYSALSSDGSCPSSGHPDRRSKDSRDQVLRPRQHHSCHSGVIDLEGRVS